MLDDARHWNDKDAEGNYIVPNGSLIFVDEAWKWFGHLHDATRQRTPRHVLELAEHRHRGLDFVWTTQQPNQLYPFVRGLIGAHSHVVRRFGTKMLDVYRWGELNEEIKSLAKRDMAQRTTRCCPLRCSDSTSLPRFTRSRRESRSGCCCSGIDRRWRGVRLFGLPVTCLACGHRCRGQRRDAIGVSRCGPQAADRARKALRALALPAYAKDHLPRIGTMPWTAPVFDDRQARSDPQLVCMSSMEGLDAQGVRQRASCRCLTEQARRMS